MRLAQGTVIGHLGGVEGSRGARRFGVDDSVVFAPAARRPPGGVVSDCASPRFMSTARPLSLGYCPRTAPAVATAVAPADAPRPRAQSPLFAPFRSGFSARRDPSGGRRARFGALISRPGTDSVSNFPTGDGFGFKFPGAAFNLPGSGFELPAPSPEADFEPGRDERALFAWLPSIVSTLGLGHRPRQGRPL